MEGKIHSTAELYNTGSGIWGILWEEFISHNGINLVIGKGSYCLMQLTHFPMLQNNFEICDNENKCAQSVFHVKYMLYNVE